MVILYLLLALLSYFIFILLYFSPILFGLSQKRFGEGTFMELFNKPKSRLKICIILLIIGFFIGQFFILAWLVSWFFVFKKDVESLDESYEYTPNADTNIEEIGRASCRERV